MPVHTRAMVCHTINIIAKIVQTITSGFIITTFMLQVSLGTSHHLLNQIHIASIFSCSCYSAPRHMIFLHKIIQYSDMMCFIDRVVFNNTLHIFSCSLLSTVIFIKPKLLYYCNYIKPTSNHQFPLSTKPTTSSTALLI